MIYFSDPDQCIGNLNSLELHKICLQLDRELNSLLMCVLVLYLLTGTVNVHTANSQFKVSCQDLIKGKFPDRYPVATLFSHISDKDVM